MFVNLNEAPLEKAVGPVGVLLEAGRVPTGVTSPVLGQKDAVGVIGPTRAGKTNIIGA